MHKTPLWLTRTLLIGGLSLAMAADTRIAVAQGFAIQESGSVVVSPAASRPTPPTGNQPTQKPKSQPAKPGNSDQKDKDKKPDDKKEKKEAASSSDPVKRPNTPPRVPDPRELDVEVVNGRVRFGFNGQPWPDVLQWLANASKLSLDWQEQPPGYINLTTQRSYTLAEARDLINRYLQARGYVMLLSGEVLSVSKIDKLDPSLVPRIGEDELYDRQPHDFVKVTFQLPKGMDVKEASEDVKQALSKHAKLMPLAATKRLLVIDAVANLRLVSALLNEERLEKEGHELPKRFPLRYARAEQVIETLYIVLGIDPAAKQTPMNPQQMQKHMQMMQQMQKQGKKAPKMPGMDKPEVHLAYNRHDNSILANAEPEQLEIINRTIHMLDIPSPGMASKAGAEPGERYAKTYALESIEPDALIRSLQEIGNLDPLTDLRGDKKAKVLFALATEADHQRVDKIIQQLDGPKHRVEVFWLRRHPADAVAGTIAALIGGKKEKKKKSRYPIWHYRYGTDLEDEDEEVELRVDADIENNRLLVRGNDAQLDEVRQLLMQLGELPSDSANGTRIADRPIREFDALDPAATDRLLEQLRASWPAIGGAARLRIEDSRPPNKEEDSTTPPLSESEESPENNRTTGLEASDAFRLISDVSETADEGAEESSPAASLTVTEDGRLVISSDDPELLMRLEQLVDTLSPRPKPFHEFKLEHVAAWYVHGKLEDFYEEILNAGKEDRYNLWGEYAGTTQTKTTNRLSSRRRLRMVYNGVTNSIVVTNASQTQINEIQRLIDIWDQPPLDDVIMQRRTGMVKVRYSRASVIEEALKDVYRDLLSARDKEFDTEEDKGGGFSTEKLTQIEYSGTQSVDPRRVTPTQRTKAIETTFDGALSIGVDELANMLVISADAELYDSVVDMIQQLDEQARPKTTVEVVRVDVSAGALREALGDALDRPWPGGRPEQRGGMQRGQQPQQNNGQKGRGQRPQNGPGNGRSR